uniref:Synaptobrevin, longin-like domain protein n=1 Tax=Tanacetum cinerariifolium TaxID=118510 RepID=A0A6L2MWX0_TANCI|nr:hypothetical protein [Tanacetum cinerariifolium]
MYSLFVDTHNVVAILEKSDAAEGFEQIIDFLSRSYIHYALTVNLHIYISCIKQFWNTASVKRSNDVTRLQALVDRKNIVISEAMGYEKPSTKLTFYKAFFSSQWKFLTHTLLQSLSSKRTSRNEFSTAMASAIICLSKGQKFNFSKYIFDSLVRNVDSSSKFYMYPRFIQLIIQNQVGDLSTHTTRFISLALTQKVFANIRRVGKGFSGVETPLFEGMLAARQLSDEGIAKDQVQADDDAVQENVAEDVANDAIPLPPSHDIPSPSQEQSLLPQQPQSSPQALPHGAEFPTHFQQILDACFTLTRRVENLEHDKAAQKLEIIKLKARVKRLERTNKGRMSDDLDKDEGIKLVVDQVKDADIAETEGRHAAKQAEKQAEIYHLDLDQPSKVLSMQEDESEVQEVVEVVTTAKLITDDKGKGIMIETPKPMKKKDQIKMDAEYARKLHEEINKDHEEINKDIDWDAAIDHVNQKSKNHLYIKRYQVMKKRPQTEKEELSSKTPAETPKLKDKGKGIMIETLKPMKKKDQIKMDAEYARKLHEEINKDHEEINKDIDWDAAIDHSREEMEEEDQEVIKSINETPAQKAELDEFIKSSVENLVPNPSESEGENGCDVPASFTTFSNILFDADYDFYSVNDQSLSDEDFPKEIYSNPLFDEEIISMRIDPHHFNAESDLIESLLNHDSSIISSSSKIDSIFDEFVGELTLLKSIPSVIDETDCYPEEETHFTKRLLYDNSFPRPQEEFVSENSDAKIESFSPSYIPIKDSGSLMEEIDLSFTPDDPMPPGIEEDDYDSERDILILKELLDNYSLSLPKNESFHFDIPSSARPPAKPPDGNT